MLFIYMILMDICLVFSFIRYPLDKKKKNKKERSNIIGIPLKHKYINYILYTFLNADTYIHVHNIVNSTLSGKQAQTILVKCISSFGAQQIHWENDHRIEW